MKRVNGFLTAFNNFEDYDFDEIYITIAIKGGIAERIFQNRSTGERVEMNPAAGRIYLKYLSKRCTGKGKAAFASGKYGNYITVRSGREHLEEELGELLGEIYTQKISEDLFVVAKEDVIAEMRRAFKDVSYRLWYYMLEFTEVGKQYAYHRLAKSLQTMTCGELDKYAQYMAVPKNSVIMVNGRLDETVIGGICRALKNIEDTGEEYLECGYRPGAEQLTDRHLIKTGDGASLGSLYFAFPDCEIPLTDRMVLLLYASEILFGGKAAVSVDSFDASIIYYGQPVGCYEIYLNGIWTPENVEKAKGKLLERFQGLMCMPEKFGIYMGEQIFSGIDFFQLYEYIRVCDAKMLYQAYKKADVKVVNGAVISIKEGKNGQRVSA